MAMLSHPRSCSAVPALALFSFVFFAAGNGPSQTNYRAGTSEVRISFFATDDQNRLVETITKDDFAVIDSGMVIRDFRSLAQSDETELNVVVVLDSSESVTRGFGATITSVSQLESQESLGENQLAIVSFAGIEPDLLCAGNCRSLVAKQKLVSANAAGQTPLFDTLSFAAKLITSRHMPGVRDILILFSDGNDTISMASARDAMNAVAASGAVVYAVNLSGPDSGTHGTAVLERLAKATGGRCLSAYEGVLDIYHTILADQRASYVVTYQLPARTSGFHSLRILPKHKLNLQFHCRRGYYYEEVQ